MKPNDFESFRAAFPGLFAREYSQREPFFGFDLPPGWSDLVWELCEKLEPLGVQAAQVKEKFGGLRFYTNGLLAPGVLDHIQAAEKLSFKTCQDCGAPGTTGNKTKWLFATLCPAHMPPQTREEP